MAGFMVNESVGGEESVSFTDKQILIFIKKVAFCQTGFFVLSESKRSRLTKTRSDKTLLNQQEKLIKTNESYSLSSSSAAKFKQKIRLYDSLLIDSGRLFVMSYSENFQKKV